MYNKLRLLIVSLLLIGLAKSAAAFPLKVDIGSTDIGGQIVKAGWEEFTGGHQVGAEYRTFDVGGVTVGVTISIGNGNAAGYRNYPPGGDVGQDMVYPDDDASQGPVDGSVIMTLSNIPAGSYSVTSYHNDSKSSHPEHGAINVTVSGAVSASEDDLNVPQTRNFDNDNDLGQSDVMFTTNGVGDVIITYAPISDSASDPRACLNGFELGLTGPVIPTVEFDLAASEAVESVSPAVLSVSLSNSYPETVTVEYAVTGGTATGDGVDYTFAGGILTFDPNQTTPEYISISIVDDGAMEDDETIIVTLSNPSNGELGTNVEHTYTILDPYPYVGFEAGAGQGMEDITLVEIPVSLSLSLPDTVTVNYAVTGGTASGGGDYILADGVLSFAPGQTTPEYITIEVVDDGVPEDDETIIITLSNPVNAKLGANAQYTYTILDTSPAVGFETSGSQETENTSPVNITVILSHAWTETVTVDYAVTGGTATGGGVDYILDDGTVQFEPGQVSENISIAVIEDDEQEIPNETVEITLSNPVNAKPDVISRHIFTILAPVIPVCPKGDLNSDCRVNMFDIGVFVEQWLDPQGFCAGSDPACANLNGFGAVNVDDFALLAENWMETVNRLLLNEFMASNNNFIHDPCDDYDDWIEIYNPGDSAVNIAGMYVTDDLSNPTRWWVPDDNAAATTIEAHGYLVIWADNQAGQGTLHAGFGLSADGEEIGLFDAGHNLVDSISFGPQNTNESYGRLPDGSGDWQIFGRPDGLPPTPGAANGSRPNEVLISELMYHPSSENELEEYIELFNNGDTGVDLTGWQFTDGVDFVFPSVMLGAGEYLVVAANEPAFTAKYPGIANVIGGWQGHLSNKSENIELANALGTTIDELHYADEGDWSVRLRGPEDHGHYGWVWSDEHDGDGRSLELVNPDISNDYGQNWAASQVDQGTPGTENSVADGDIAPLILDVLHWPIIPRPSDAVMVTARVIDELSSGVTVKVYHRVDNTGSPFTASDMYDDGLHGDGAPGDGVYATRLPVQADRSIVEFYIEASDATGNVRTWPGPVPDYGQAANLLYQVDGSYDPDSPWVPGSQPIYYIIQTKSERDELQDIGNNGGDEQYSDAQMNTTFVSRDASGIDVGYLAGARNRGHGSRHEPPMNYRINFAHDRPWKDVTAININSKFAHLQWLSSKVFNMAGMPAPDVIIIQVRVNGDNLMDDSRAFGSYAHVEVKNSEWAENHFPADDNGNIYRCIRDGQEADLRYEGTDPDAYRDTYFKKTNEEEDDWSDLINMTYVLNNAPQESYLEDVSEVINIREWMRYLAMDTLMLNCESGLNTGLGDDYALYSGVVDRRFVLVNHDQDTYLEEGDHKECDPDHDIFIFTQVDGLNRLLNHPTVVGLYYQAFFDLFDMVYNPETMNQLIDELDYVAVSNRNGMKQVVVDRMNYVLSVIEQQFTVNVDLPTSGGFYYTTTNAAGLYGTADATETRSVTTNGHLSSWSPKDGAWSTDESSTGIVETLISRGALWSYLDNGSNQGTSWRTGDVSSWATGPAELGYGDGDEATVVSYGPDAGNKYVTTYFRLTFTVANVSEVNSLTLGLLRDDGAVVYLNGYEVARSNMPGTAGSDDVTYTTLASSSPGEAEELTFFQFDVDPGLLVEGDNVIAAEVHQFSQTSTDVSFDLELTAVREESGATGGVLLNPGINRVIVETFDGPNGSGDLLRQEYIDIWYDDGSESYLSGTVGGDMTLDAASGPWHITGSVTVPAGVTLTIEAGTTLFFDSGTGISISSGGRLVAEGSEYQRIRFTRVPGGSNWGQINFGGSLEDSRLTYADLDYGGTIDVSGSQLLIDDVTWADVSGTILDVSNPRLIVRSSVFPPVSSEMIHGGGIPTDGYFILEGNTFGFVSGNSDVIDFTGGKRPGPIFQVYDNVFLGGDDDCLDLDGTDAHIEGNIFMNFHYNGGESDSTGNPIATGESGGTNSEITVVRNIFYDNDHMVLLKEDCYMHAENNVVYGCTSGAINFDEPGKASGPGRGAYLDGMIFLNNADEFQNFYPSVSVTVNRSIIPADWHDLGQGNIDADPLLADPDSGDFSLLAGSPALATGPNGLDMGAMVHRWASISGEPAAMTYHTDATLTVGGPGITHYRYRVNDDPAWSEERLVEVPIHLTGLVDGMSYTVYVIGRNSASVWQNEDEATASSTWTVDLNAGLNPGDIVISELLAHSHLEAPDWVELHNTTNNSINIGGWFLSDSDSDLMKYEIAEGTSIGANGHIVFYENQHFGNETAPGCHTSFALSQNGETVYVRSGQGGVPTGYGEQEEFGASESNVAFGRYYKAGTDTYDFVAMSENTPGAPNTYPKVGPIVINEIMYHPRINRDAEYVELLNISDDSVTLYDSATNEPWRFTDFGGIDFLILDNGSPVTMAPDEHILLVRDLNAFNSEFTAAPGTQILEWVSGRLDNAGENIELSMAGDVDGSGQSQYIRIDGVDYSDGSHPVGDDPWPTEPDGTGKSLSRKVPGDYGNDLINWQAATRSPGSANP